MALSFDPEDAGDIFVRNFGWTTRRYTLEGNTIQKARMLQTIPGVNFLFSLNLNRQISE
jgi:hypothetical protein